MLPVSAQRGGCIDPRSIVQLQIILHRDHGCVRHAGKSCPDKIPGNIFIAPYVQIFLHTAPGFPVYTLIPAQHGLVVMGPRVYNTVRRIIVRQIGIVRIIPETELQDLHAGISGFFHQGNDFFGQKSQIFRDHIHIPQRLLQGSEQIVPRSLNPMTVLRRIIPVGHEPIGLKSPEMIDPHHVIQPETVSDTADPPRVTGLPVIFPAVAKQWKALKSYANEKGIRIVGDIPIYVAFDSADTWANPELFQLDGDNVPIGVAGCPPDAFCATGQLWGNPTQN